MAYPRSLTGPIDCPNGLEHPFFRWATDISSTETDWRKGLVWQGAVCVDTRRIRCLGQECDDDQCGHTDTGPDSDVPIQPQPLPGLYCADPFTMYVALCSGDDVENIKQIEELQEIATEALDLDLGRELAGEMIRGDMSADATDLTGPDAMSFARGLGLILRNRVGGCTHFSVPEIAIPYMMQEGLSDGETVLGRYPLIPVPTNTAPDTNDGATGFWIYGHGPIDYAVGEVYTQGWAEHLENRRVGIARRDAIVRFDQCRTFAVAVQDPGC